MDPWTLKINCILLVHILICIILYCSPVYKISQWRCCVWRLMTYSTCSLFYSERKLQATEYPHNLYIQNYSTATSTCLAVRKWLFSLSHELSLAADDQATTFIFWQAVDDVNRGHIRADDRLYQLKALQDASRKHEVTLYHLPGQQNYYSKEYVVWMGERRNA